MKKGIFIVLCFFCTALSAKQPDSADSAFIRISQLTDPEELGREYFILGHHYRANADVPSAHFYWYKAILPLGEAFFASSG